MKLNTGALQSVTLLEMLNGANAAALEGANGNWEVFQFADAEEIDPGIWVLSTLLRGQLGTDDAFAHPAQAGARFVMLDGAVVPAGLRSDEIGRELNWRCGPVGYDLSNRYATTFISVGGMRALRPLSPVRLRGLRMSNGDHQFGWTRRGRIDADSWLASEIPLGEDEELYSVQLMQGENIIASAECDEPRWTVPAAQIAGLDEVVLQVRQISRAVGHGIAARCVFNFNI